MSKLWAGARGFYSSFGITILANAIAAVLTLQYANGVNIVETNPVSQEWLGQFGYGIILLHIVLFGFVYGYSAVIVIYLRSKGDVLVFRSKSLRSLSWTVDFVLSYAPISATLDAYGDVVVTQLGVNPYAGPIELTELAVAIGLLFAFVLNIARYRNFDLYASPKENPF